MVEMLRIQEEQAKYGTSNEFTDGLNTVMNGAMNAGECVLTYMWVSLPCVRCVMTYDIYMIKTVITLIFL